MAVWTIQPGGIGSGQHLAGCRIVMTESGGLITYQFLPPLGVGSGPLGSSTISPPNIKGVSYNKRKWDISSTTTPPLNPRPGARWDGSCFDTTGIEDDPGTWAAESGGGGIGGKGKGKKGAKGTSKKGAKGTKSTSKKGTKSAKSTKSAKGTRGRG